MKPLITLWKFCRPHTVIGSVISILTLYVIVQSITHTPHIFYLIIALCIGITCNIFIVGINQVADIHIDKINKPYLPLPSGELTLPQAKWIVIIALSVSLILALIVSVYLFLIVAMAAGIGWAYSMPPIYLKKHHVTAALAIATVRGILLNAGGFLVFNYLVNNTMEMPQNVKILTLFIIAFSIVISWFKDLSDVAGDKQYNIKTFAIQYSSKTALIIGNLLVALAYIFTILMKYRDHQNSVIVSRETYILLYGHILLLGLFVLNAFSIQLTAIASIRKFYVRFWWFFFAEYLLYLIAYVL